MYAIVAVKPVVDYYSIGDASKHFSGIKNSKLIVEINKVPEAPIFALADDGREVDLLVAAPERVAAL